MLKNWTRFQKLTVLFLSVSLLISIGIIVVLLVVLQVMERRLNTVGNVMEEMAVQHIITEVTVDESIPLKSDISVMDELVVNIDMTVNTEIPFTAKIPVSEEMLIPFKIGVRDYIKLDTTIQVTDWVNIDVNDTIPLNQKVKMPIFGERGPSVPIQGKIPVQQQLRVGFSELLPVHSVVPVDMLIIDTLPVGLDMKIPVNVMVPVSMPIKQQAKITFNGAMPVDAQIPITLTIPVDIPLSETSLAVYFRKLAAGLKGLTNMSLEDVDLEKVK
ncbi:MAG: hypothetical protein H6598_07625 [Flavobacteriales bacterium]|nr:hypothetical protein [Flavobacteriales bacterium]